MPRFVRVASLMLLLALPGVPAHAQANPYTLLWGAAGGGGNSSGGAYGLSGSTAQPGGGPFSGGSYSMTGGLVPMGPGGSTDVPTTNGVPTHFHMLAPRPNPFIGGTAFLVDLPRASSLDLRVYDVAGQLVRVLANGEFPAGRVEVRWDGADHLGRPVPAGMYFGHVHMKEFDATVRVVALTSGGVK